MPIYEYECGSCHSLFELRQRFDEEPVCHCPTCKGKARRVIHSVPVVFKGSGFYVTDNRKGDGGSKKHVGAEGEKSATAAKGETAEKSEKKDTNKGELASKASDKS